MKRWFLIPIREKKRVEGHGSDWDSRVAKAREILGGSWSIFPRAPYFRVVQFIFTENARAEQIELSGKAPKVLKR